jgi:hypothetical protein
MWKMNFIEHVVNVKTLNDSEHNDDLVFHFFLLKLKILEAKVKFWCGTHMTQLFRKKFCRYLKLSVEQRICQLCHMNVEDELHFLMNCDKLIHERVTLFRNISDIVPSFTTMSDVEKFMFLFYLYFIILKLFTNFQNIIFLGSKS